jgi:hypothetical protein
MAKSSSSNLKDNVDKKSAEDLSGVAYWKHRGPEDVYYQRESQTTWWTVLGGVAVAALLTRLETAWGLVISGNWHYLLYIIISALIILQAWLQISWGVLVIRWRISLAHTLWVYITGLALSFMSLSVTNLPLWWLAITVLIVILIANQYYFYRSGAWVTLPENARRRILKGLWVYGLFALLGMTGFILLGFYPLMGLEVAFGVTGLLAVIVALYQQNLGMNYERGLLGIP